LEGFFWNLPEFGRRTRFDIFHGCETCPLEAHLQSWEQQKVTRSEIESLLCLGYDMNVFRSKQLLHNKRCMARCVVGYRGAETTVPPTRRAASSELHRTTSAKLARRNDQ
jgi:hypothetical protein